MMNTINTETIILLAFSLEIKLKFYCALFLVAIASNLIIVILRGFSKITNNKESGAKWKVWVWDLITLAIAVLVIKFQGDFILSLIGGEN